MIPPQGNTEFVAAMEQVLDVYRRPYNPDYPVVCMDESLRQLIGETRYRRAHRLAVQSRLRVPEHGHLQCVYGGRAAGRNAQDQGDRAARQARLRTLCQ